MDSSLPFEWMTGQARRAVWLAHREARRFEHDFLSSSHLLAGLLREDSQAISAALREQNIEPERVLDDLDSRHAEDGPRPKFTFMAITPRVRQTLTAAVDQARSASAPALERPTSSWQCSTTRTTSAASAWRCSVSIATVAGNPSARRPSKPTAICW